MLTTTEVGDPLKFLHFCITQINLTISEEKHLTCVKAYLGLSSAYQCTQGLFKLY